MTRRPFILSWLWLSASAFAADPVEIVIEPGKTLHSISPTIYGVSAMPIAKAQEYGVTALRWGGNRTSRYNWKTRSDNAGADWFFLNGKAGNWQEEVAQQEKAKIASYVTIPLLPWVAKGSEGTGFSVAKYGPQQKVESYVADRGNGIKSDGTMIKGNDPRDTSVGSTAQFQASGVKLLPKSHDRARVYGLDNEPMLWSHTHRDVHPLPATYDEVFTRGRDYAREIKKVDPESLIAGPVTWGWTDLTYSALDEGKDRYATHADNQAHEGLPFVAWYLRAMAKASKEDGKRLLDLCDVHIYPQGQADGQPLFGGKTLSDTARTLRIRATRGLWDPTYKDESWINQPVMLIPRVREWVDKYNPGVGICVGEYSWGGDDDISGAIAQAEVLGIFAREKVDHAYFWAGLGGTQKLAMKLYRNPSGKGPGFGETYLTCRSSADDRVSVFAATRKADHALTVVLVQKETKSAVDVHLTGITPVLSKKVSVTQLSGSPPILTNRDQVIDARMTLTLPPLSATLLEFPGTP